jgi:hypothetical protein
MVVVVIMIVVKILPIFAAIVAEVLAVLLALAIGTILAGRLPRLLKLRLQIVASIGRGGPSSRTGHSIA